MCEICDKKNKERGKKLFEETMGGLEKKIELNVNIEKEIQKVCESYAETYTDEIKDKVVTAVKKAIEKFYVDKEFAVVVVNSHNESTAFTVQVIEFKPFLGLETEIKKED